MRIELYGIARRRAGTDGVRVAAATLGEALAALAAACPGLVPEIVADGRLAAGYLASRNGDEFLADPAAPLAPDDVLLVLTAQAGG